MKNNLKNKLIELDFTANEAEVFNALLELGSCSSGPIIAKTQLHRNVVYTSLDHLIKRKMIAEKNVRGVKHFSVTLPIALEEEFEQKALAAKSVAQEIAFLMTKEAQEITIHQGNEEYFQLLSGILKSLPKGSTKYVMGTGGEIFMAETMRLIWKKYHQIAQAQNIKIKMISYESQRESIADDVAKEKIYEVRYINDNIENPAGVHIYPEIDTVLNIIYTDKINPVTAIRIKNKALAQGYIHMFNNLWVIGKE
jgi:sugar-specific transcriptional regulator TrmB